jgi:hypothetical protein
VRGHLACPIARVPPARVADQGLELWKENDESGFSHGRGATNV